MIYIFSKKEGFHRGGVRHPLGLTKYADETFSKEQMEKFQKEPMLTVEIIKDGPEPKEEERTPEIKKQPEKGETANNAKKKST
jgi:hypothetical protein